jgi:hypothetical protein
MVYEQKYELWMTLRFEILSEIEDDERFNLMMQARIDKFRIFRSPLDLDPQGLWETSSYSEN